MADLATDRQRIQDLGKRRDSDGAVIVRDVNWQLVTYPGGVAGVEPVDSVTGLLPASGSVQAPTTDKEITGIQGMDKDLVFWRAGTGGDTGYPL